MHPRHILSRPTPAIAATAVTLLSTIFYSFAFSVITLWTGHSISAFIFPLSFVAATVTSLAVNPRARDAALAIKASLNALFIIIAAIVVGIFSYDYSSDGLFYHQEIIAALLEGWNPFSFSEYPSEQLSLWTLHYAKAVEISATSVVALTGYIESGKAINFIAIAAMTTAVYAWLSARSGAVTRHRLLLTLAITANPIVWSQAFTYYIDFYKYIYLIFTLLGIADIAGDDYRSKLRGIVILAMTLILAMATKFNMFFEAGVWMVCAIIWTVFSRRWFAMKTLLLTGILSLMIGALLTYHPYVTNFLQAGHPLFPLLGEGAEDIMTDNTPAEYLSANRFITFFSSLFSVSNLTAGTLQGGFTILMPMIMLLSLWLLLRLITDIRGVTLYIIFIVLASCFFFEQAWWARYICQLWIVPFILVVAAYDRVRAINTARFTAWLMIAAGAVAIAFAAKHTLVGGIYHKALLDGSASQRIVTITGMNWGPQFRRHLEEANVNYHYVPAAPCPDSCVALYFYEYNPPLVLLPESSTDLIRDRLEFFHLNYPRHIYGSQESIQYFHTK